MLIDSRQGEGGRERMGRRMRERRGEEGEGRREGDREGGMLLCQSGDAGVFPAAGRAVAVEAALTDGLRVREGRTHRATERVSE